VKDGTSIYDENFEVNPKYRGEAVEQFRMVNWCDEEGLCNDRTDVKFLPIRVGEMFPNLIALFATGYDIKRVKREHLSGMKKLQFIGLWKNLIDTIDTDAFAELIELKYLGLSSNKLRSLSPRIFDNNGKLERINLYNNQLKSVTALVNLQQLLLCTNKLESLPGDIFASLSKLQKISLHRNNRLSTLDESIFRGNGKLREITIGKNLTKLSPELFANKPDLSYVSLRFNPCINKFYGSEDSNVKLTDNEKNQLKSDVVNGCS
jgi:Leucine-rich repeat (LRR) protein